MIPVVILLVASLLLLSRIINKREGFESYPYTHGTLLNNAYHGKTSLLQLNNNKHEFPLSYKHITYPKNYVYRVRGGKSSKVNLGGCQHNIYNTP